MPLTMAANWEYKKPPADAPAVNTKKLAYFLSDRHRFHIAEAVRWRYGIGRFMVEALTYLHHKKKEEAHKLLDHNLMDRWRPNKQTDFLVQYQYPGH